MKTWVLVDGDRVADLISLPDDAVPGVDVFLPEVATSMIDVTDLPTKPEIGWVREGSAFSPPPPPVTEVASSAPLITFKADIFRRCTDAEADKIDAALKQASTRQRRLFDAAQFLDHSAEEFVVLRGAVVQLFGEPRADELLAVSAQ